MKRFLSPARLLLTGGLVVVLGLLSCCLICPKSLSYFEFQYEYRIHEGMTLEEAEKVLGKATKEKHTWGTRDGPVVQGDEYYVWVRGNLEIWVGARQGRITGKWFRYPSL